MKQQKHQTTYNARDVANVFIDVAQKNGVKLSNLKLQKLVYITFGYYAAAFNQRLFSDEIQAWQFGPVIPNLYHELKRYGSSDISHRISSETVVSEGEPEMMMIEKVWDGYSKYSGIQLSQMTHADGTPWKQVWDENKRNVEIPFSLIRAHYEPLYRGR